MGQSDRAGALKKRFESFALSELDARNAGYRARARYLLALVRAGDGRKSEAVELLKRALEAEPDFLPAWLEQRGDTPAR